MAGYSKSDFPRNMEDAYLFQVLKTLNADELGELMTFAASDYFDRGHFHQETQALLSLIFRNTAPQPVADWSKEQLYQHLFPDQSFIKGKLEKVMSELNKLVRTFLLWQHYFRPENEFHQLFDWVSILRQRGLETRYQQTMNKAMKLQDEDRYRENTYYYRQFLLEYEMHDWQSLFNRKKGDLNIPNTLQSLDIFYYLNRLELLNRFLLQSRATYLEIPEILTYALEETQLPERYLQESCVLLITYKIHLVLKKQNPLPAEFDELGEILLKHENEINPALLRQFYTYLRNLCVILINGGSVGMLPNLHRLHRDNLSRGYLYYNNLLPPSTFLIVTSIGLKVKNAEWVKQFIEQHRDMILGDNETKDFYRLGLAYYYFEKRQFSNALDYIPTNPQETDFLLKSRRLELMTYYELNSELLPYKLDAYKMFISRASHKLIPPQIKDYNTNFINLLLQIVASAPGDKDRSQRLMERIGSKQAVAEREWLLEKAASIG